MSAPTPDIADQAAAAAKPEPESASTVKPGAEPRSPAVKSGSAALPITIAKGRTPRPNQLPPYTRSLLRIKVPVVVTLAENRQPLHRIVELGPGSIIQFDKSCEETLDLSVGEHTIASGEAVKVGDKFGLRITSIILPEERFLSLRGRSRNAEC